MSVSVTQSRREATGDRSGEGAVPDRPLLPLLQVERPPDWIAGWFLGTVASRLVIVWLCNNTGGSVLAAILFHDVSNVSWQLFPNDGSHYDPRISGVILALVAAAVVAIWGPRTLAQCRRG